MRIYLVKRTNGIGYDEYDAWVVSARSRKEAWEICKWADWIADYKEVKITLIGESKYKKAKQMGQPVYVIGGLDPQTEQDHANDQNYEHAGNYHVIVQ